MKIYNLGQSHVGHSLIYPNTHQGHGSLQLYEFLNFKKQNLPSKYFRLLEKQNNINAFDENYLWFQNHHTVFQNFLYWMTK